MAVTTPTHVDTSIPEIWSRRVLRDQLVDSFWGRWVGGIASGAPIVQQTELLDKPGDQIHIQVTNPLTGAGVSGDTATLEGNEENLATSQINSVPLLYRHGVRSYRRANKKSIIELRTEARMRLAEWGREKMDNERFSLYTALVLPSPLGGDTYAPNVFVPGGGADDDACAVGDTLTVESIQQLKLKLRLQRAKPVMHQGRGHYILVTHPNAMHQLKRETEYRDWVREAEVRGKENPFFQGALAMVDGMVLFDHENVPQIDNATSVQVAHGIAFGAEAFVEALDENVSWVEDTFDYGHEFGVAYGFAFQSRRALELSSTIVYLSSEPVAV